MLLPVVGIPFERAIYHHRQFGRLAVLTGLTHGTCPVREDQSQAICHRRSIDHPISICLGLGALPADCWVYLVSSAGTFAGVLSCIDWETDDLDGEGFRDSSIFLNLDPFCRLPAVKASSPDPDPAPAKRGTPSDVSASHPAPPAGPALDCDNLEYVHKQSAVACDFLGNSDILLVIAVIQTRDSSSSQMTCAPDPWRRSAALRILQNVCTARRIRATALSSKRSQRLRQRRVRSLRGVQCAIVLLTRALLLRCTSNRLRRVCAVRQAHGLM